MYSYLIGTLGVAALMCFGAYGASEAITLAGTSSIMYTRRKSMVTQAYVALIMTSTIFTCAFILSMIVLMKIGEDYPTSLAMRHFCGCIIYGIAGYSSGASMGNVAKRGFKALANHPSFFFIFTLMLISVELILIFALLISFLIIFG
jgi:F0F1-type ATP synthase membrane subunit c/vacuolar-type H+-ATPase subunit K